MSKKQAASLAASPQTANHMCSSILLESIDMLSSASLEHRSLPETPKPRHKPGGPQPGPLISPETSRSQSPLQMLGRSLKSKLASGEAGARQSASERMATYLQRKNEPDKEAAIIAELKTRSPARLSIVTTCHTPPSVVRYKQLSIGTEYRRQGPAHMQSAPKSRFKRAVTANPDVALDRFCRGVNAGNDHPSLEA